MKKILFISFLIMWCFTLLAQDRVPRSTSSEISPTLRSGSYTPNPEATWDVLLSFDLTALSGLPGNAGAEWDGTYFYSTRWASNLIHKYNSTGTVKLDSFSIPGVTGLRDLAFDGTYMYGGAAGTTIYQMDFVTKTLIGTITSPVSVRWIEYDPVADGFWVGNWADAATLISRSGTTITSFTTGLAGQYGAAYDASNPGGPYLWIFDQGAGAGTPQYLHQFKISTGTATGIIHDVTLELPDATAIAGGLFSMTDFSAGVFTIGGVLQGTPDKMFVYDGRILGPGPASNPTPINGAVGVSVPGVSLSWTNPGGTTTNNVYFGTSPGSLAQIHTGSLITSIPVSGLTYSTQYYWRVDEIDGTGTTTGAVWTFTTTYDPAGVSLPYSQAFPLSTFPPFWTQTSTLTPIWALASSTGAGGSPYEMVASYISGIATTRLILGPINTAGYTSLNLAFKHYYNDFGPGATLKIQSSVDGITWTDETFTIASGGGSVGPATVNTPINNNVGTATFIAWVIEGDLYQINYWHVDDVNVGGPCLVTAPSNPSPADGSTGIPAAGVNLQWTNGASTTNVEVWFGPTGSPIKVYDGIAVTSYATGALSGLSTYQWHIVCKDANCSVTGPTWSFTTEGCPPVPPPVAESFDGAFPPACWGNFQMSGTGLWTGVTSGVYPTCMPYSGAGMAKFASYNYSSGTAAILVSPQITFPSDAYRVIFWMYRDPGYATYADRVEVYYNTIPGVTGATLLGTVNRSMTLDPVVATEGWYEYIFNVPTGTSGNAYIIFDGISLFGNNIYVDDIGISQLLANDVGTFSVDVAALFPPGSIAPQATVKNYGSAAQTFNVQMTITGGYSSTKPVTALAPGTTQQVTFDNWNATVGPHTVNVCTQLAGDLNTANDCKSKDINVSNAYWSNGNVIPYTTYMGSGVTYVSPGDNATGYLFSIGGNTPSATMVEGAKYNIATNTWTPIASLPSGRGVFSSAVVGDSLYVIGGYDPASVTMSTVLKYSIISDAWASGVSLPAPLAWSKAVTYNNRIYVAGGYDGVAASSVVYVYNPATGVWAAATSLPAARFGGAFSISGNKLIYVGGADLSLLYSTVYVGTIDAVDPLLITWVTMLNKYPGISSETISYYQGKTSDILASHSKPQILSDAVYPPGTMFRFDAAPWGSDGIIVAGGSPTTSWLPANPNPCFVYKPGTDSWIQQINVTLPVLGSSLGSYNTGTDWKLIVASGYTGSLATDATQIFTDVLGSSPTTFPLTVNVLNGWNMVSIPGLHPTNQNVTTWWPGKDPAAGVFKFAGGYQAVTVATPGIGYWMKNVGAQTYNTGDEWPAGGINMVAHDPIPGLLGWNLIGGYDQSVATAGLTTTPPGLITGSVYKYAGGYVAATTLDPGYGYWIKLTGAGVINIPAGPSGPMKAVAGPSTEGLGKIIITDNTQKSYTLFAADNKTNLSQFDLPPYPPQGMFDVRYSSQRCAENLSTQQAIEMTGVQYPVRVKAEGVGIILSDETGKEIARLKAGEEVTVNTAGKLYVSGNVIPLVYSLEQNYPNPFNPSTTIQFSIPEDVQNVKLIIYSALGEKVAELVNTGLQAGIYKYNWNANNVASGLYIYQIVTEKFVSTKKMMLLK